MVKASHLLRYSSLKQLENESGAEFVDREQKEYLVLRDMGINVDDSLRLTKFIQQDSTNSKHKSLAQTIFTTPNMTLNRATSLFETYHPGSFSSTSVVNALFCRYCKKDGHDVRSCNKKKSKNQKKKHTRPDTRNQASSAPPKKKQRYPCAICDSMTHLSHKCPRREDVKKCLQTGGGSSGKLRWGSDEQISDDEDK